ncbi:carbonic anhydrase family protein [Vibrio furnissii]|uniref:carbonic anhydrase family protein n=1 Tax=Vibrio furnissii TaxID=29494 RepID=UPI00130287EC|nr:carbonic anhydrase family protein [Vibrio furnissii]
MKNWTLAFIALCLLLWKCSAPAPHHFDDDFQSSQHAPELVLDYDFLGQLVIRDAHAITRLYAGQVISSTLTNDVLVLGFNGQNQLYVGGTAYHLQQIHLHFDSFTHDDEGSDTMEAHFVNADAAGHLMILTMLYQRDQQSLRFKRYVDSLASDRLLNHEFSQPFPIDTLLPASNDYVCVKGAYREQRSCEGDVRWLVLHDSRPLPPTLVDRLVHAGSPSHRSMAHSDT